MILRYLLFLSVRYFDNSQTLFLEYIIINTISIWLDYLSLQKTYNLMKGWCSLDVYYKQKDFCL